jgi:hypothetical protein
VDVKIDMLRDEYWKVCNNTCLYRVRDLGVVELYNISLLATQIVLY